MWAGVSDTEEPGQQGGKKWTDKHVHVITTQQG